MNAFPDIQSYWDITQQPETFSALPDDDFLAFLQKQFPTSVGTTPNSFDTPADGVDPQSLTRFPSNTTPSSSDSSPSPPSLQNDGDSSRRQSEVFNTPPRNSEMEDSTLKRKASDESITDEPTHKSQHTTNDPAGNRKSSNSSRRKSTGGQDESRLLKRKEQNRAAQRAFRERKEKHVKDLEDKVAALEAKNIAAENENENLRDLLSRLQSENMVLKQTAFTFSVPHNSNGSVPSHQQNGFNFASPGAGPSKQPVAPVAQHPSNSTYENTFGSLISFDPNMLMNDETTATDGAMNMEFGLPVLNSAPQYKTIASNPNFMSFAEPSPFDSPPLQSNGNGSSSSGNTPNYFSPIDMNNLESWSPDSNHNPNSMDTSLDQLFGGNYIGTNPGPVDFSALLLSSPHNTISPVSHASLASSSSPSSNSNASGSSPPSANSGNSGSSPDTQTQQHGDQCPRTKEELSKMIEKSGPSAFVEDNSCALPIAPFLRKATDASSSPIVMCKGSSFPKTEASDKNVEVLAAWRSITSNPQFKDFDINELCSEFTSKARCDGTKVVLEPQGVHHIIETLAAKRQSSQ